ncbi:DgyrCDS985 [Dimorphilus gyrociliatus]|uniref:DgyrCDS985 n=1 Tax=Dimorphilus gyrociliatus TaxID=2664684 RepID=A0A7I8V7Z6_9ANNE|nr:DgyrCDS985 [Dimorphilus gyrociliatus]
MSSMSLKGRPLPNFYDFVENSTERNNCEWSELVDNSQFDLILTEKTLNKWSDNEKTPPFNGRLEKDANFKHIKFPNPMESPILRKTPKSRMKLALDSEYKKSPIYEYKHGRPTG